jgi:pimeloyl-ACP methyl ester carboxylesterase
MPYAKGSGGARIHYDVRGSSHQTVVLLHGLGLSSRFWFDQPERLGSSPDPWRVITIDNRGVGRSDKPLAPQSYTMRAMADDVAAVLDHARVERAYVAGLSLGGMIAQHVALRHAPRVEGLVLLGTSAGFPHMHLPRAKALASFLALPFDGSLRRREVRRPFARLLLGGQDVGRSTELLSGWPDAFKTDPTPTRVFMAHLAAAVFSHSAGDDLHRVHCPTVVVTGDDDALLPQQNSRTLARLFPWAHLEVVRGAGHIIPASHPECVRKALEKVKSMAHVRASSRNGAHAAVAK